MQKDAEDKENKLECWINGKSADSATLTAKIPICKCQTKM